MAEDVTVALIAGVASIVGGLIGAIGSPLGKDWVNKRDHERTVEAERAAAARHSEAEREARAREDERRQAEARRSVTREVLDHIREARTQYEKEWSGHATGREGRTRVIEEVAAAWTVSRQLDDQEANEKIDSWRDALNRTDMRYRSGAEPPDLAQIRQLFDDATDAVTRLGS